MLDAANVVMQVQPFNSPGSLTGDRRGTSGCWNFGFSRKNQTRKTKKEVNSSEMLGIGVIKTKKT